MAKKKKHYIDNKEFLSEIIQYQKKKIDAINSIDSTLNMNHKKLRKFNPQKTWGNEMCEDSIEKMSKYDKIKNRLASNRLGEMILELIKHYARSPQYNRYQELDDIKSGALIACLKALDKFDIQKDNPFAYFTTTVYRAFIATISQKYEDDNLKMELYEEFYREQGHIFVNEIKKDMIENKKRKNQIAQQKENS